MVYEKRIFIAVLALLLCLSTTVWSDGQDEAEAGKVELDFDTHMYNYEPWNGMIQTVVDKYMELNPNVVIKPRGGDYSETRQTLLSMAAAGDAVDIMNFDTGWHVNLAGAGVLTDLRQVAAPEQLADMNVESGLVDGTLFAVPSILTHQGVYSNQALMDTYGFSHPVTWDDVYEGTTQVKKRNPGRYRVYEYGVWEHSLALINTGGWKSGALMSFRWRTSKKQVKPVWTLPKPDTGSSIKETS